MYEMQALRGTVVLVEGQRPKLQVVHMTTEQLKFIHIYNISKGNAPEYMNCQFEKSTIIHDTRNKIFVSFYSTKR